tara:strand:- start:695 stop:1735 length:1041 start_codon:yes stop_codon:yes gene_type:complete
MILVARNKIFIKFYFSLVLISSCTDNDYVTSYSFYGSTMGTTYTVVIKSNDKKPVSIKNDIEVILAKINQEMSTYDTDSYISNFNKDISMKEFQLPRYFSQVLEKSFYYYDISKGLFDITVHPLYKLWGFQSKTINVSEPLESQVLSTLEFVGMDNLIYDSTRKSLQKTNLKTSIDVSAIAKGYAVDVISDYLIESGYKSFLIDIGGEIKVSSSDELFWEIGIQKPNITEIGSVSNVIRLRNNAIATSGSYSNFIDYINTNSKRCHIINPKDGYPVIIEDGLIASASVIANSCIDADAIATILMLQSAKDALNFINRLENVEAYLIYIDNEEFKTVQSDGFSKFIH